MTLKRFLKNANMRSGCAKKSAYLKVHSEEERLLWYNLR